MIVTLPRLQGGHIKDWEPQSRLRATSVTRLALACVFLLIQSIFYRDSGTYPRSSRTLHLRGSRMAHCAHGSRITIQPSLQAKRFDIGAVNRRSRSRFPSSITAQAQSGVRVHAAHRLIGSRLMALDARSESPRFRVYNPGPA